MVVAATDLNQPWSHCVSILILSSATTSMQDLIRCPFNLRDIMDGHISFLTQMLDHGGAPKARSFKSHEAKCDAAVHTGQRSVLVFI